MSEPTYVAVICEGTTERIFIESILAPHLQTLEIYITPTLITKKGEKGGDVKFERLTNDLEKHLNQRHNRCVTTFFDFYALKGIWPGYSEAKRKPNPASKHATIATAVKAKVIEQFDQIAQRRFLPFFMMHEIEALYFSCPATLATHLDIAPSLVQNILDECGEPEAINHAEEKSPSHRIGSLKSIGKFKKTSTGIAIAKEIGLQKMRDQCPLFNEWVEKIEALVE